MGCHSSWQDACLLYQGAHSNLIQDIFITKPQDPDQSSDGYVKTEDRPTVDLPARQK